MSDMSHTPDQHLVSGDFHGSTEIRDGTVVVYSLRFDVTHTETDVTWQQRLDLTAHQLITLRALLDFMIEDNHLKE